MGLAWFGATGCSSQPAGTGSGTLPLVTPAVRAAAPAGLGGDGAATLHRNAVPAAHLHLTSLDGGDVTSRFFEAGPTDVYSILGDLDQRISDLNAREAQTVGGCLGQEPIPFPLDPFGETVAFYAQCFETVGAATAVDPEFLEFGRKDGVLYYYSAIGAERIAATLAPPGGGADASSAAADTGGYAVHAWLGVGYENAASCGNASGYDDCSYGVIELSTNPGGPSLELSVAGIGFGYCGAQLRADANQVDGIGSADLGTSCSAPDTFCLAASDLTTPVDPCDASSFTLPSLGRTASAGPNAGGPDGDAGGVGVWAASGYPGASANRIVLDGTSDDSLQFGPSSPTPGVMGF